MPWLRHASQCHGSRGAPAAGRLYGRHLRPRGARPLRRQNIHVNCGSPDMIDQFGSRPRAGRSRCGSIPDSATATAGKPTLAATVQTRHLAHRSSATAWNGRPVRAIRERAAYAHRLRHRPGAPFAGVRRRWRGPPPRSGRRSFRSRRRRAADPLPAPRPLRRSGRLFRPLRRRPASGSRNVSAMPCGWRSSPAATSWPRAASCWPRFAP